MSARTARRPALHLPPGRAAIAWLTAVVLFAFEVIVLLATPDDSDVGLLGADWVHTAVVLMAAVLCWWRAAEEPAGRGAWMAFGAAIACFGIGEGIASVHGSDSLPIPSVADLFWLLWYPFAIAGIALLVRHRVPHFAWHRWVDGLSIVLLLAIPGVGLVLQPILDASPQSGAAQVLAFLYPLADLLLIGAVLGVLPLLGWRPGRVWAILALGLLLLAVADAVDSATNAQAGYVPGVIGPFWSGGVLLIALAAWQSGDPPARVPEMVGWKAVALPVATQACAAAIQLYAYFHHLPDSERLLTVAVLLLAIVQIIASRPVADDARLE